MAFVCEYSGKKVIYGNQIVRRGKAKRKGGIGQHVTGITRRRWKPNLQKIRVIDEKGRVKRIRVCARYIRAGKFMKAPRGIQKMRLQALKEKQSS